jgi:membrane protease YdiL (CAAX protease family)
VSLASGGTNPILTVFLLALALGSYWFFLRGNIQSRPAIARWLYGGTRARFFALWCARALMSFAGCSLLALGLLGRADAVIAMPAAFAAARGLVVATIGDARGLPLGMIFVGLLIGGVIGGIVDRLRRGRKPWMLGDISAMLPRHRGELIWGIAISVVAGVGEELYFRLLVPLLVTLLTGLPLLGIAVGIMLFAGAHRYQGWLGVAATTGVGALLTVLYLMTGALWLAMLVHIAIDLNGLVLRPIMAGVLGVSSSAASPS